jgi:hypothetical protein
MPNPNMVALMACQPSTPTPLTNKSEFYDTIQEAPDAYLTNDEANQYLKSILKMI